MVHIAFKEVEEKYYLKGIRFDSLKELLDYTSRWFPNQDIVFYELIESEKKGENKCLN